MRISKLLVGLVAAGFLATGCGSDSDGDSGADDKASAESAASQAKLPVPVKSIDPDVQDRGDDPLKIAPKPGGSADFTEQVERKLRETLLRAAAVEGETSAECPNGVTQKASAVSECTATYEGAKIPFEVTISDKYREGSFVTSYQSSPQKGLLSAKAVHRDLFRQWGEDRNTTRLACDKMPAAKAVDLDVDTGYKCQAWEPQAKKYISLAVKVTGNKTDFTPLSG